MGTESKIQWTNATVNFWTGCKKVSEGCKFCYMYRDKERYGKDPTEVIRTAAKTFYAALTWNEPKLIFTCSWSDFFIEEADEWRADAWEVIRKTPHHTWQILTKRPERILQCLPEDWGNGYPNVWLGVSVENQKAADERIPILVRIPATIRFLSCEPLLGSLDLRKHLYTDLSAIHWAIIGGESGHDTGKYRYRECYADWIMTIVNQCQNAGISVFVKQLGTFLSKTLKLKDKHGGDIDEWPNLRDHVNGIGLDIRIRQFPKQYQPTI